MGKEKELLMKKTILTSLYHLLWGRLQDNPELRRYYLYRLFSDMASGGSARFGMSYLYFQAGVSAQQIAFIMGTYAVSSLLVMQPVVWIVNALGIRKAFLVHFIPDVITSFIMLFIVTKTGHVGWIWPSLWMFTNAWAVMLERIPTTAYFTHFGKPETRGADLGLANIFERFASIAAPIVFGALMSEGAIVMYIVIKTVLGMLSSLMLGFKKDANIRVDVNPYRLGKLIPASVTKAFFVRATPAAFIDDLFFIWLVTMFSGNYKVVGIFYALKLGLEMLLSWLVGKYADLGRVRTFYMAAVFLTALFWVTVPFAASGWQVAALQFSVGLASLVVTIPFEREYHNMAKQAGDPLGWAIWREVAIQAGMAVGCTISFLLIGAVADWHWFMMLGAFASLAMLWILPQKEA